VSRCKTGFLPYWLLIPGHFVIVAGDKPSIPRIFVSSPRLRPYVYRKSRQTKAGLGLDNYIYAPQNSAEIPLVTLHLRCNKRDPEP